MSSVAVLADLHLGRPQHGEGKTGPGIDWAFAALRRFADANHMVMLGDIIDRKRFTDATYAEVTQFFELGLELFDSVTFIAGNHDVHHDLSGVIPAGVTVAGIEPQTIRAGEWALHTAAVEVDRDPRELLGSFPPAVNGAVNLGLLHSSVTGEYSKHDCLPCTVSQLQQCGYDAWLLGHVHEQVTLAENPFIGWVGMGKASLVSAEPEGVRVTSV